MAPSTRLAADNISGCHRTHGCSAANHRRNFLFFIFFAADHGIYEVPTMNSESVYSVYLSDGRVYTWQTRFIIDVYKNSSSAYLSVLCVLDCKLLLAATRRAVIYSSTGRGLDCRLVALLGLAVLACIMTSSVTHKSTEQNRLIQSMQNIYYIACRDRE